MHPELQQEYGVIDIGDFKTESDVTIKNVQIAYERVGDPSTPIILVCHALTGNQYSVGTTEEPGWWSGLIGPGKPIDSRKWQVITMNVLGGCNGSTGPLSLNPSSLPYRAHFPFISVRDIVNSHYFALQKLGIEKVHAIIGGSLGGMQVLEWGILYPHFANLLFPLATAPFMSDFGMTYNAIARFAILNDPEWQGGNYKANPQTGLSVARMLGMISYRSPELFNQRFNREQRESWGISHQEIAYQVDSYLQYQGKKFLKRFDTNSYLYLLKAMDHHDIGRDRGGWQEAISAIKAKVIAFSFKEDIIYSADLLASVIHECKKNYTPACHYEVDTIFGHDGFLVEFEKWGHLIKEELNETH
ncbi:homoserine O-acetyltransferase MetX [Pseudoneobacillus sp. C159]